MAQVIKTKDASPMGEYHRTAIDDAKDAADILITGYCGERATLYSRVPLTGAGIRDCGSYYTATERALARLRSSYAVMSDF